MTTPRWQRLRQQFERASESSPEQRALQLTELRASDPELARELEQLLASDGVESTLLDEATDQQPEAAADQAALAEASLRGCRVGPWELTDALGQGGSAIVYAAVRHGDRQSSADDDHWMAGVTPPEAVAVKVLHGALVATDLARRFEREARALAALRHPGIVALYGTGVVAGRACLVMERVVGQPLDAYCDAQELGAAPTLGILLATCAAVSHAHSNLVVHRDLKPQNILVAPGGRPKVLDFGVAKLLAPDEGDVSTHPGGLAPLTLRYASPEQRQGLAITTACDVYALGVLVGELLATRPGPDSADLAGVVAKACDPDPRLRYSSVDALADDLERLRAGFPVQARVASRRDRATRFLRRHRLSASVCATLLAALLASLFVLHGQWRRAVHAEGLAWSAHGQALQVANFFQELIGAADGPGLAADEGLLAALAQASDSIGVELAGYPEAESRLRYSIALLFAHLDRDGEALPHARLAAQLARDTVGFDAREVETMAAFARQLAVRLGEISDGPAPRGAGDQPPRAQPPR